MSIQSNEQQRRADAAERNGRARSDRAAAPPPRRGGALESFGHAFKWLRIGMRVKRWLLVALIGIAVLVAGVDLMFLLQLADLGDRLQQWLWDTLRINIADNAFSSLTYQVILGLPTAMLGLLVFLYGVSNILTSITSAVAPSSEGPIVDVIWRRRQLAHGARIVVIGGGTGLSTLLRGLKEYTSNITAIVTVTDDGGSSGRLQREFNMLPPGDIRNCLVALADAEPLMQELFQYRFQAGERSGLEGHSFGNILIAAMLHITGDFEEAVRQTSRVLAIRGRVLPSTVRQVRLMAELDDGTLLEGETNIARAGARIKQMMLSDPDAEPLDEAIEAINTADAIVIGPGSVYTSVVPNFLVQGVAEAVANSRAAKMYVCNVMTQPGETDRFTAADHVKAVLRHAGMPIFDYVLVNVEEPNDELRERYARSGSDWVLPDVDEIKKLGLRSINGDFMSQSNVVRHNSDRLAEAIVRVANSRMRPLSFFWAFDLRNRR
ncbi:MAG: uridine diphosphate-N-acetylglucosamine-binding protein YvcK [Armatimonadota bacterium]